MHSSSSVLRVASKSSCKMIIENYIMQRIRLTAPQLRVIFDRMCTTSDGERSEYMVEKVFHKGYAALDKGEMPSIKVMLDIYIALNKPFFRKKKSDEDELPPDAEETSEPLNTEEEQTLDHAVNNEVPPPVAEPTEASTAIESTEPSPEE